MRYAAVFGVKCQAPMLKHRKIIGYTMFVYNGLALVLALFVLLYIARDAGILPKGFLVVICGVLATGSYAGLPFARGELWTIPVMRGIAFFHFLNFPLGTLLGAYCFWFYWKFDIGNDP